MTDPGTVQGTIRGMVPIAARSLSKWYGQVIGVNDIQIDFEPGITGLLGPNGAGKSTLLKLIGGQLRPSLGEVLIYGQPVWNSASARQSIGFAPEEDSFHEEMSGLQFVYSMARLTGLARRQAMARSREAVATVGMSKSARKPMRACSRGMRQRIKIAQALAHDPPILVLDEPLTGIDPPGRLELLRLFQDLRNAGKTIILSSHILEEIEAVTGNIVLMAQGRVLVSGNVRRIRDLLDEYPLTVRIECGQARALAQALMLLSEVTGVALGQGENELIVKVRRPESFFCRLPRLVVELGADIRALEPVDASVAAIFDYLIGPSGSAR